jgi:GNAT superfamily N-acetyltransferase
MFTIRRARPDDAPAIAALRTAVWPDETVNAAYMAEVIQSPDHATLLAMHDGMAAGFVDGFLTLAPEGSRRWEIDLLAVAPAHQGRGMGKALVAAATAIGPEFGTQLARALIKVDNQASQRAFRACGYQSEVNTRILMVLSGSSHGEVLPDSESFLIPVATLGYRGLWVEGVLSAQSLTTASAIYARHQWDIAGTVIAEDDAVALDLAAQAGYMSVGRYHWWQFTY